jgi:protein O-GlcNAc transferase
MIVLILKQIMHRLIERTFTESGFMQTDSSDSFKPNILDSMKLEKALRLAKTCSKNNRIAEAQNIYQDILQKFSKNKQALEGLKSLDKLVKVTQNEPPADQLQSIINLCNQGEWQQALDESQQRLKTFPESAILYDIAGTCRASLMQFEVAIDNYKQALSIRPRFAEAYNNMAVALNETGNLKASVESCKQALKINSNYAEAYNNMGNALSSMGDLQAAMNSYRNALDLKPNYPDALYNIGNILKDKGDLKGAINYYNQTLKIKPNHAEAHNNMGLMLSAKGDLEAATNSYEQAITIEPSYADAYYNKGNLMAKKGDLGAAISNYKKALNINPNHQSARSNKLHNQAHICDWEAIIEDQHLIPSLGIAAEAISPFVLQSLEDAPARHRVRSELFNKKLHESQSSLPHPVRPKVRPERIRVGYFSADFHQHAVAYLIAKVLETHDRNRFEIYGYSIGPYKNDEMRRRLIKAFDVFDDISEMNNEDAALLARQDRIDIVVDLTGYTQNSRQGIFAYRAAPVQINYLGYSGTMGTDFIDYIIADPIIIPTGYEHYYSECILRLPNTFLPTDNERPMSKRLFTKTELGLPETGFVFCCFNNNNKITTKEFDIWMRVLLKVEGSVLWLRNSNEWSENNLRSHAETRGVESCRIIFAGRVPMEEHLARYKLADLFLDTFAYNAHTTASEALWAGLPVVTKAGEGFSARAAASLLSAIALPELITKTRQDYESLTVYLASNPDYLAQIRKKLANNRLTTPLFDTTLYTKHLENGYQQAYQRYFDGGLPKDILVPNDC